MQTDPPPTKRFFRYVFFPVLLALVVSSIVNLQLFQDGGSYLFEILQINSAAIRHNRISAAIIQLPTIIFLKIVRRLPGGLNEHLSLVRIVFCLSYALIPVLALLLSWMVARKQNTGLFVWAAIIILFINLVNFSGVSELLIAIQFCCPLMLATILSGGSRASWILIAVLLPFIFFLHPLVPLLFITLAAANFYIGLKKNELRPTSWKMSGMLMVAGVIKLVTDVYFLSKYESSFLGKEGVNDYVLDTSLENQFLLLVSLLIGAGVLIGKTSGSKLKVSGKQRYTILIVLATIACLLLVFQYSYQKFPLKTGLSLVASLAIFSLLALDATKSVTLYESVQRFRLVNALAILFFFVVISKSVIWGLSVQKLRLSISKMESPCLEMNHENFKWLYSNPYKIINTWALPSLALIEQNNTPRKLLLEENSCKNYYQTGLIKFDEWSIIHRQYIALSLQKK